MSKIQLAVMDTGEANRRILNKDEYRAVLAVVSQRTNLAARPRFHWQAR